MDFFKLDGDFTVSLQTIPGWEIFDVVIQYVLSEKKVRVNGGVNKRLNKQKKILFSDKNDRRNNHVDRINSRCTLR